MFLALVLYGIGACGEKPQVLWNDECPYSFGKTPEEGKLLQKEIPDFDRDFRLQLAWQGGEPCRDPNEKLSKEIGLTRKVISDVLKPEFIPNDLADERFLLLRGADFKGGKRDALVVKFAKGKYIFKFMKTRMKVFVTVRPVSGETIDVQRISQGILTKKIQPVVWKMPLYCANAKRESKIMRAGMWSPQDDWTLDSHGHPVSKDYHLPIGYGPIGLGLYDSVHFYTDGKFISYKLLGGPPLRSKKADEDEGPGD